jgi:2-polyprenyl-6-methoxyphenol hydroxylase-like FAD-dependent oxidoreductase
MKAFLEALVASIPTERIWYETSLDKWLQQREERQRALSEHAAHAMMNPLFTVGADGARSVVRHRLLGDRQPLRPAGYVAHTGITNVPVVQAPRPDDLMTTTTLQELTAPGRVLLLLGRGDGTRLGVHRIDEQTVFWFFCENVQPPREFQATGSLSLQRGNETKTRVWTELSRRLRTPQGPLWNALEQLIRHTPASAASTVHCADLFPPTLDGLSLLDSGPVALVGDAAHPMTPNLSQGAGLALEDAWTLANLLADEWTNCSLPMVENIERLGQRIRQKYRRQRYWRTGLLSLRSRLTGAALQQQVPLPALVTLRNRVLLPLALQPQLFVSHARSKPLSLP